MGNRFLVAVAVFVMAQAPAARITAGPLAHERWQRTIVSANGHGAAEQCVILDAELFAHAAPGLRDLRLMQGDRELPYAVDESHDGRESGNRAGPLDDRSVFDRVGYASFVEDATHVSDALHPPATGFRVAKFLLPAHVPVERITLLGRLDRTLPVQIVASPRPASTVVPNASMQMSEAEPEIVQAAVSPGELSLPVTLGANLQNAAAVKIVLGVAPGVAGAALEMRRRELCFKPVTDAPVRIVYGDPDAELIHYDYAQQYKPIASPVLATLGPRENNPAYKPPLPVQTLALTLRHRVGLGIGVCLGMLAVTLGALIGMRR